MCVLTENVRAGADSVQRDTGRLWFINTNQCVYIRHKLRIGGLYTVSTLALTHTHKHPYIHTLPYMSVFLYCIWSVDRLFALLQVAGAWPHLENHHQRVVILILYFDKWGFVPSSTTQLVKTVVMCSVVLEGALQSLKREPDNDIRVVWVRAWDLKVKQKAFSTNWVWKNLLF